MITIQGFLLKDKDVLLFPCSLSSSFYYQDTLKVYYGLLRMFGALLDLTVNSSNKEETPGEGNRLWPGWRPNISVETGHVAQGTTPRKASSI